MTRGEKIYTGFVTAFAVLLGLAASVFLFLLIPASQAPDGASAVDCCQAPSNHLR